MSSTTQQPSQWLASGLFLGSVLALSVLMFIPQPEADALTYLGLAAGLLLAITSFATFLNLQLRKRLAGGALEQSATTHAVRQGVELGVLVVGGAFLWAFTGMSWWEGGLLVAAVVFAEIALSFKKNPFAK